VKTSTRLLVAAAAILAAAGITQLALAQPPAQPVPPQVAVPAGHKLFLVGHATGVQIYRCDATPAGPAWSFVAPRASLYDRRGKLLTTHFAGPTWQAKDGSFVVGRVVDRAPAEGTIPWLLLEVASSGGPEDGRLARTAYIQRLATTGGLAPASGCDAGTVGAVAEIPYTADYAFWRKKGQ
jgi:hypothetical protein